MPIWRLLPCTVAALWLAAAPSGRASAQPAPPAHATAAGAAFTGLDAVILIDQSGSMWGHPRWHPVPNDRFAHRIGAAREVIERLLADVWRTPVVHRISVIDFGDSAEVAWSDQEMRYDPRDPEALGRRIKVLLARRVRGLPWINTNTPLAMRLARQELAKMSSAEPSGGRRRIVLLITDGRPDLPGVPLAELRSRVTSEAGALAAAGAELWVIGIDDGDSYWQEGDGDFWERLAGPGRARRAETASAKLSPIVGDIVDGWLGTSGCPAIAGDHYDAPAYLGRLTFRVSFMRPRGQVRIFDPAGFELPLVAGGAAADPGTYAYFSREDPTAGSYRIQQDGGAKLCAEETAPRIERLAPAAEVDAGAPVRIDFAVRSAAGQPLRLLDSWPLRVRVRVTPPRGGPEVLEASNPRPGIFEALWKPAAPGSYQLELQGLVRPPGGRERDVFAGGPAAYTRNVEVSRREPYQLRLAAPPSAARDLVLHLAPWARSATVSLALYDPHGRLVSQLAGLVREPASWLAVQLLDPAGLPLGPPRPAVPGAAGGFTSALPVTPDAWAALGVRQHAGINLKVVAQPGRLPSGYYLSSLALPPGFEERRIAGDPWSVGPIRLRLPLWLAALRWLAAAALLAAAGALLLVRGLPSLLVRREDAGRRGNVQLKLYDAVADPSALSAVVLPVGNGRRFKLDRQVSLTLEGGQRVVAERFRVTRLASSRRARARLDYSWHGRREGHRVELTAGSFRVLKGLPEGGGHIVAMLSEGRAGAE
jgi:Mg-chelatase subunit ChlD